MLIAAKFVYMMSLVVWLGAMIFFSFFAAPSIFKVLPRQTAGDVVGDIFPKYWKIGYVGSILLLISFIYISKTMNFSDPWALGVHIALVILSGISGAAIGGKAKGIKNRLKAASDTTVIEQLTRDFRRIHAWSSIVNLLMIILGIVAVFFVATRLS